MPYTELSHTEPTSACGDDSPLPILTSEQREAAWWAFYNSFKDSQPPTAATGPAVTAAPASAQAGSN